MKIGYDFHHELGIDILDYFAGERSWWEFYEYLYELPQWGKFQSALAMDEEYAETQYERIKRLREEQDEDLDEDDESNPEWKPKGRSPEGWTPELATLNDLHEQMQSVARILVGAHSKGKPPDIQKRIRPVTALDLLELESERDDMQDLAAKFGLKKKAD